MAIDRPIIYQLQSIKDHDSDRSWALVDRAISQGRLREIWAILEQYWLSYVNFWECHLYLLSQLYDV
jgi:hypothetical protein